MFFYFLQLNLRIIDILTKSYKITIACFKPTISVGSTLTHVRYYLDDPVHLLVSCIEVVTNYELRLEHQVFGAITRDHNFVHQVFGAVAGDY